MRTEKLVFRFFCLLAVSALLIACGKSGGGGGAAQSAEKPTILLGIQTDAFITDYKNNKLTQWMEERLNINLEFYLLPTASDEVRTKFSLMVSSDDMTDVLFSGALSKEQILAYGTQGIFVPLNDHLKDQTKAPNYWKIPEPDRTDIWNTGLAADGNIYSLPRWEAENWNLTPHRIYINKAWLDKLGLDIPVTTQDLKNVLIAFRDRDPNGNGRKDEIGLYGWFTGGYGENTIAAIINSFIFYNNNNLSLDEAGTKVIAPFAQPNFRKALIYLNDLYKEGVLSASLFTDNQQQYRAALNTTPSIVGLTTAGSFSNWANYNQNANFIEMTMIEPLTGPDGISWTPYSGYVPTQVAFITNKAKDVDLCFKFMESFFDPLVSTTARYGEQNVDWSNKPEDLAKVTNAYIQMGLYPSLTVAQLSEAWSNPTAQFWHNMNPRWAPVEESQRKGSVLEPYDPSLPNAPYHPFNYQHYSKRYPPQQVLPALAYNLEDATNNAEAIINVNEYVRQSIAEFTISTRDINSDADWDSYLKELDNLGLQRWLTSAQATFDRQK